MATGDVGHSDTEGRLFVSGRVEDMIIRGGENVFPGPVEEVLLAQAGVIDVAVVGVDDDEFGHCFVAYVCVTDRVATSEQPADGSGR